MSNPKEFKYTREHEWIHIEAGIGTIGITDYALEQLGDVVHLDLPKVGQSFKGGTTFGTIESTKTVSDLYMPVSGKVTEINTEATKNLEALCKDPYRFGWLIKASIENMDGELMSADEYEQFTKEH